MKGLVKGGRKRPKKKKNGGILEQLRDYIDFDDLADDYDYDGEW